MTDEPWPDPPTDEPRWQDPRWRKAAGEVLADWLIAAFCGGVVVGFVFAALVL